MYVMLQIVKSEKNKLLFEGCYLHIAPNYTFVSVKAA